MAKEIIVVKEGKVTVNSEIILAYESFNNIWKQTGASKKFVQGGERAIKELGYVGVIAGATSIPNANGYNEVEADEYAREKLGLPASWEPSDYVKAAIKDYRDETESIAGGTINELIKTFSLTKLVIKKTRASLQARLSQPSLTVDQAKEVMGLIQISIDNAAKIPKITRDLRDAMHEYSIDEDDGDDLRMRGTGELVPDSYLPEKSL